MSASERAEAVRIGQVRAPTGGAAARAHSPALDRSSSVAAGSQLLTLQRFAGNRAVSSVLQRCGPESRRGCPCIDDGTDNREKDGLVAQRALSPDFVIRGKSESASIPANNRKIFFDFESHAIDSDELRKIGPLTTPVERALVLHGFASEEGGSDGNRSVVQSRIDAVAHALRKNGHEGSQTPDLHLTETEGEIAYRDQRRVDVVEAGGGTPVPPGCEVDPTCEDRYQKAVELAKPLVKDAQDALGTNRGVGPMRTAFLDTSKSTETKVRAGLASIAKQIPLHARSTHHFCKTPCTKPSCTTATAINEGRGEGVNARLVICRGLFTDSEAPPEEILIHEAAHGGENLGAQEHARSFERMFQFLHPSAMPNNADSYRLYARLVHGGSRGTVAKEAARAFDGGFSESERGETEKALLWQQHKLSRARFTLASVYERIHLSRTKPGTPEGREIFDQAHTALRRFMAPRFGTTDPTDSDPPAPLIDRDQWIVAGLSDRYGKLLEKATTRPRIVKAGAGGAQWQPGPGDTVTVGRRFLAGSLETRVRGLVRAIIDADPEISAARKAAFADLVFEVTDTDFSATEGPAAAPSPPTPGPSPFVGLTRGDGLVFGTWDKRPLVEAFQQRLAAGGLVVTPDGMFGPSTAKALNSFQRSHGLPPSDTVDAATAAGLGRD
jgi:putative peptidoglycan binding protein